ncbi:MAG TPA: hypothetical protein VLB86_08765 [Gaiellaceae bacterium]|nr:hypothetical protein [Gaiellaceae bacterium]
MDELTKRIERLRVERQALRAEGASGDALERNRRALVDAHRAFVLALLERYAGRPLAA